MKRHWVLAVALSLAAVGAPPASTAAGDEDTSGGGETRSSYEQALRRVETAKYEDALEILKALNRSEPGDADMLNVLGHSTRKLGRAEAAFGYYREALAIEPRHLEPNECLGAMRKLDRLEKSLASAS